MDAFARPSLKMVFGIPVRVSLGWLILATILIAITIDALRPAGGGAGWFVAAAVGTVGVIASLALHELAHIAAARKTGGAVIAVEPAMFGALSDDAYPPQNPLAEAWVAGVGPVVSLLLTALFGALWYWLLPEDSLAAGTAGFLALVNLAFFAGNALPGFPLDGGRVFRAFVWYLTDDLISGTRIAASYGQAIALSCFVLGAVLLTVGDVVSVWGAWGLIALWSINGAGREGFVRTIWREMSRGLTLDDVGLGNSSRIDAHRTIDDAIDDLLQGVGDGPVLVRDQGQIIGIVTLDGIRRVPRAVWSERIVRDVTVSIDDLPRIQYDASLTELAERFERDGQQLIIVETRGKITGALERETAIPRARSRVRAVRAEQRLRKK